MARWACTSLPLTSPHANALANDLATTAQRSNTLYTIRPLLLGARTLLGAPGLTTRNKKLLGAFGIATRSKDAISLICSRLSSHLVKLSSQVRRVVLLRYCMLFAMVFLL